MNKTVTVRLALKKDAINRIARKQLDSPHELSMRSGVSYPTVRRYTMEEGDILSFDGVVLAKLLQGAGLTEDEILNLRLGDLFQLIPDY